MYAFYVSSNRYIFPQNWRRFQCFESKPVYVRILRIWIEYQMFRHWLWLNFSLAHLIRTSFRALKILEKLFEACLDSCFLCSRPISLLLSMKIAANLWLYNAKECGMRLKSRRVRCYVPDAIARSEWKHQRVVNTVMSVLCARRFLACNRREWRIRVE